jgi:Cupin
MSDRRVSIPPTSFPSHRASRTSRCGSSPVRCASCTGTRSRRSGRRSEIGVFGANGKYRQDEFGPGDVAFINRGFGHYIRQIGNEEAQILVAFNSPDYQEISLSSWLASNPPKLLADNFGLDLGVVEKLPHAGRFIVGRV